MLFGRPGHIGSESLDAQAPGLGVPALSFESRVACSSSIARPGSLAAMQCPPSWNEAWITPSGSPPFALIDQIVRVILFAGATAATIFGLRATRLAS